MKIKIPYKPKLIIDKLLANGYEAGLVGGCLRNIILGLEVKDYDIATSAKTSEMKELFAHNTIISLGEKFGTLIIVVDRENIEVTTFRKESSYKDHRHPDMVDFVSNIEEDLKRRDFTINALYYNDKVGLIDLFQSIEDIKSRKIRAVGDPMERFTEDPLRILRGIRFAAKLGFDFDQATKDAILSSFNLLSNIKVERIAVELVETLNCNNIASLLTDFSPVFQYIIPDLKISKTEMIDRMPNLNLKLAVFFNMIEDYSNPLDRMMELRLTVSPLLRRGDLRKIAQIIEFSHGDTSNVFRIYRDLKWDRELLDSLYIFLDNQGMLSKLPDISLRDLAISGSDVKDLGYRGDIIQEIIDDMFYLVLQGKVSNIRSVLCDHITEVYPR